MNLLENITLQYEYFKKGLLTYNEMLNGIIKLAEAEKSYIIEYKAAKNKPWKPFTDTFYSLAEAQAEVERISNNDAGFTFRYKAID
jgi:hypothetical protein